MYISSVTYFQVLKYLYKYIFVFYSNLLYSIILFYSVIFYSILILNINQLPHEISFAYTAGHTGRSVFTLVFPI